MNLKLQFHSHEIQSHAYIQHKSKHDDEVVKQYTMEIPISQYIDDSHFLLTNDMELQHLYN